MSGFSIALMGLDVAQKALELIGSNIANATTEGYHKQTVRTVSTEAGGAMVASGVKIVARGS